MTLSDYLKQSGVTQTALARFAGLSQSTISLAAHGRRRLSAKTAEQIALATATAYATGTTTMLPLRVTDLCGGE